MADQGIPEIIEGKVPEGVIKADRAYLEVPQDEVPGYGGRPVKEAAPQLLSGIKVIWDQMPLLEAVNEAVGENNINKVIRIFNGTRIEAKQEAANLVRAICLPGK